MDGLPVQYHPQPYSNDAACLFCANVDAFMGWKNVRLKPRLDMPSASRVVHHPTANPSAD
jgi:hypothetical protein